MDTQLKVSHLINDTYQVVQFYDDGSEHIYYQGSLSDCEAYIRLQNSGLLV